MPFLSTDGVLASPEDSPEPPEPPEPPDFTAFLFPRFPSSSSPLCLQPSASLFHGRSSLSPSLSPLYCWTLLVGGYEIYGASRLSTLDTRGRCLGFGKWSPCSLKLKTSLLRRPPLCCFPSDFGIMDARGLEIKSSFLFARGRRHVVDLASPPLTLVFVYRISRCLYHPLVDSPITYLPDPPFPPLLPDPLVPPSPSQSPFPRSLSPLPVCFAVSQRLSPPTICFFSIFSISPVLQVEGRLNTLPPSVNRVISGILYPFVSFVEQLFILIFPLIWSGLDVQDSSVLQGSSS